MTDPGFNITPAVVITAGDLLSSASDNASRAGTALLAAGEAVNGTIQAGTSISATSAAFGLAVGAVCADLVESATGLGASVNAAARLVVTVETTATYRFGALATEPPG